MLCKRNNLWMYIIAQRNVAQKNWIKLKAEPWVYSYKEWFNAPFRSRWIALCNGHAAPVSYLHIFSRGSCLLHVIPASLLQFIFFFFIQRLTKILLLRILITTRRDGEKTWKRKAFKLLPYTLALAFTFVALFPFFPFDVICFSFLFKDLSAFDASI